MQGYFGCLRREGFEDFHRVVAVRDVLKLSALRLFQRTSYRP